MKKQEVEELQKTIIENDSFKVKNLLIIKTKLELDAKKKGAELNLGYQYEVDGAIPEIADAIAKFAKELPKNNMGKDSDSYFITLINEYYKKL